MLRLPKVGMDWWLAYGLVCSTLCLSSTRLPGQAAAEAPGSAISKTSGSGSNRQTSDPSTSGPSASPATSPQEVAGLPDSPGAVLRRRAGSGEAAEDDFSSPAAADTPAQAADKKAAAAARASDRRTLAPCGAGAVSGNPPGASGTAAANTGAGSSQPASQRTLMAGAPASAAPAAGAIQPIRQAPCTTPVSAANPYTRFLNSTAPIPLTPRQKAHLAVHNFVDPSNIVTILGTSAIAIGSDAHTAYGPGMRGFGENAGLSFVQDATGDFFGTFLIPSIAHEDPHYHRRPEASVPRRIVHAISRTVIAQGDDGHPMPNYATLLTYPITAEIANLYVPGVAENGPSTVKRVLVGYGTDPIDNLITEFLPDVAKRVHVRVIFVQQIINQVAAGQPVSMF